MGTLGNKRAFDPPLYICNLHAPSGNGKYQTRRQHDTWQNERRTPTVSAFSDPLETGVAWNRVAGLTGPFQVPGHVIYLRSWA